MNIPTPHNQAMKEDLAPVVIMPGDPMRSAYIAEKFLDNARLVNNIRGVQGYTGKWKGQDVSVMASGMGIPSMSIYSYELYHFYHTEAIIRIGTAGSIREHVGIGDVLFAEEAYTNSSFLSQFSLPEDYRALPDPELLKNAMNIAEKEGITYHQGKVLTQEIYYSHEENLLEKWLETDVAAFEMETAALYANAAQAGKRAMALFTISNSILSGEEMDPVLRERSLDDMIQIGLDTALTI